MSTLEVKEMSMSIESGVGIGLLIKAKLLAFLPALIGAALMAVFRPPKTRKEMLAQAAVALGCSFLFGNTAFNLVDNWIHVGPEGKDAVLGLVGALSWGAFGGLAHFRDKVAKDPLQAIKDAKDTL